MKGTLKPPENQVIQKVVFDYAPYDAFENGVPGNALAGFDVIPFWLADIEEKYLYFTLIDQSLQGPTYREKL